jgi:hypothetical protein
MYPAAKYVEQIEAQLGDEWMGRIYRERILTMRTRAYGFDSLRKGATPEIHHTLLGIELKFGQRRILCPDLPTARYLAVFARLGSQAVAIPYDITKISLIADELESSWHRMLLLADSLTTDRTSAFRTRLRKLLIAKVRAEIAAAGPGPRIPEFKQTTRQREPPPKGTKCAKEFQNRER